MRHRGMRGATYIPTMLMCHRNLAVPSWPNSGFLGRACRWAGRPPGAHQGCLSRDQGAWEGSLVLSHALAAPPPLKSAWSSIWAGHHPIFSFPSSLFFGASGAPCAVSRDLETPGGARRPQLFLREMLGQHSLNQKANVRAPRMCSIPRLSSILLFPSHLHPEHGYIGTLGTG